MQSTQNKHFTINQDLSDYLAYKESYLRDTSFKVYRNFGQKFGRFLKKNGLTNLPTAKFSEQLCEDYRREILKLHKDNTTRNKEIGQIKTFFYHYTKPAYRRFKISPAAHLELLPKKESELHEPYSEKQVGEIIGAIIDRKDYRLLLAIYLIHYGFIRPGRELRLLKVSDIKAKTIRIRPELSKTHKTKTPTITQPVEELLDALQIRSFPGNHYVFGKEGKPGPVPVGKNHFYHRHRDILLRLGFTDAKYTLYGWKHTGNIRAVQLGIDSRAMQQQNGFADHRTMEIYLRRLAAYSNNEIWEKFV